MRNSLGKSDCPAGRDWLATIVLLAGILFVFPASAQIDPPEELECLALTIYFEARGEPLKGKIAVGYVVMNRVSDPDFPQEICGVVRQGGETPLYRCQFTWWCDGLSDEPTDLASWRECRRVARQVYDRIVEDPTANGLWYHADYVAPPWSRVLVRGPIIGRHVFYGRTEPSPPLERPDETQVIAAAD